MGEKTVTLSAYTAKRLKEYRELNDKYEKLVKDTSGIDMPHLEGDDALVCRALGFAIGCLKADIAKEERYDT